MTPRKCLENSYLVGFIGESDQNTAARQHHTMKFHCLLCNALTNDKNECVQCGRSCDLLIRNHSTKVSVAGSMEKFLFVKLVSYRLRSHNRSANLCLLG
jgi:hypothetical protein